jgi:hypothetical protein
MAAIAAPVALVGLGLQAYGSIKGANDQADAAEKDAALKELQAQEIEKAGGREEGVARLHGNQIVGAQANAIGQSGFEMSGSPLLAMENTYSQVNQDVQAIEEETRFRASMIRAGASSEQSMASDRRTAGWIGGLGGAAVGAGTILTRNMDANAGEKSVFSDYKPKWQAVNTSTSIFGGRSLA